MPKGLRQSRAPNKIRYWRTLRGLTQAELATILRVHRDTVRGWEAGLRPDDTMQVMIARVLKRPLGDVFPG